VRPPIDKGIPARLSAAKLKGWPHEPKAAAKLSGNIDVYLDGKLLGEVAAYDVQAGEVVLQQRDAGGKAILDTDGKPTFVIRRGKVEVRWILHEVSST